MKGLTRELPILLGCISLGATTSNLTELLTSRIILPSAFRPTPVFKNVNLLRHISLEKGYVRETINVVIENIDQKPQREYFLPFTSGRVDRVGGLDVQDKQNPEKTGFELALVEYDRFSTTQFYRIRLPEPLKPSAQQILSISYSLLSCLTPLPAAIEQTEKQYLVYTLSAYAPSAYSTEKQKTKVKLPTNDIPEYSKIAASGGGRGEEDPQREGSILSYGPYNDVPAGAAQEDVKIRYEFTKPINHVTVLERDVEVSHWGGNLAVEERYWLENRGANLSKQFSRVAWAQAAYYNPTSSALKELRFPLKGGVSDPYFTDDIGNVSTSRFRSKPGEAHLEIKPRYPVFGGWKYNFRVGWNLALDDYLREMGSKPASVAAVVAPPMAGGKSIGSSSSSSSSSSPSSSSPSSSPSSGRTYILRIPFLQGPRQPEGIEYEKVHVRIILPEGATNVRYHTPAGIPLVGVDSSLHRSFMDTIGRTTLMLSAINVVDDVRDRNVIVIYQYSFLALLRKPLTIFTWFLTLFFSAWLIGKIDTSIGGGSINRLSKAEEKK